MKSNLKRFPILYLVFAVLILTACHTDIADENAPFAFKLRWDPTQKENQATTNFVVNKPTVYRLSLAFKAATPPMNKGELTALRQFIGLGDLGIYDLEGDKYIQTITNEDYEKGRKLIKEGKAVWRYGHPGTIVPVHYTIQKIENGKIEIIADKQVETAGLSSGGTEGLLRQVASIELQSGIYKFSVDTNHPVRLPSNTQAYLEMYLPYNAVQSKLKNRG